MVFNDALLVRDRASGNRMMTRTKRIARVLWTTVKCLAMALGTVVEDSASERPSS